MFSTSEISMQLNQLPSPGGHDVDATDISEGLETLGYKQELTRSRGMLHILFMSLAIMSVPYSIAAPIATSLIGGGPATMIWGWVLVTLLTLPLALSLAEICSNYPTSAGAYYWCFRLASPKRRVWLSWINGWLGLVGVWTATLSVTLGITQLIVSIAMVYQPEWTAHPWQTYLILLAITVFASIPSLFFNHLLPMIDILCACWTLLGIITVVICLPVKAAAGRRSVSFALGHFDHSASGWTPGWAFFIGLLPVPYNFSAIGMIASMAEEVHKPSTKLPKAIVWSIPIGGVAGLCLLLPIVFTLPDVGTLLAVPSGQPVALLFEMVMGSKGGALGIWLIVFGAGLFCAISVLCAASRATWAFARDNALPFSRFFCQLSHARSFPLNSFLLSTGIQLLLALLLLGSSAALNAFVSVAVVCLGASYAMPVAILLANGRKGLGKEFALGRWGSVTNVLAVVWVLFQIVLFSMPAVLPVTETSMNYASVVFAGFAAISALMYLVHGRYYYVGPPLGSKHLAQKHDSDARLRAYSCR